MTLNNSKPDPAPKILPFRIRILLKPKNLPPMQLLMKIFCENKGSNPDSWIEKIVLIKLRLILVHSSCHVLFLYPGQAGQAE